MQLSKFRSRHSSINHDLYAIPFILLQALEEFSLEAPLPDDDKDNEELYDRKVQLQLYDYLYFSFVFLICFL